MEITTEVRIAVMYIKWRYRDMIDKKYCLDMEVNGDNGDKKYRLVMEVQR